MAMTLLVFRTFIPSPAVAYEIVGEQKAKCNPPKNGHGFPHDPSVGIIIYQSRLKIHRPFWCWLGRGWERLGRLRRPSPGRRAGEGRGPSTTLSQALRSWLGSAQDDMGWG